MNSSSRHIYRHSLSRW